MKAVIWKELREHSRWTPIGFLIACGLIGYNLHGQVIFDLERQLPWFIMGFGGVASFLLAVIQCRSDRSPEARALLLHRGVTPIATFYGKLMAGLAMYSVMTIVPLMGLSFYFFVDGLQTIAAYPDEVVVNVLAAAVGFVFWPTGVLVMHREAGTFGSRFFPAITSLFLCFAGVSCLTGIESSEALIFGTTIVVLMWMVYFISSASFVERLQLPVQRTCLWLVNTFCLIVGTVVAVAWVNDSAWFSSPVRVQKTVRNYAALGKDGELWHVRDTSL